jgi:hypothetical protein
MQYSEAYLYPYIDTGSFYSYKVVFDPQKITGRFTVVAVSDCVTWQAEVEERRVRRMRSSIQRNGLAKFFDGMELYADRYLYRCNSEHTPITVIFIAKYGKYCIFNGNHRSVAMRSLGFTHLPVYEITRPDLVAALEASCYP